MQRVFSYLIQAGCFLVLFATALQAEPPKPIELLETDDFYQPVKDYAVYYTDETLELGVADVLELSEEFNRIETPHIDFGIGPSRHWLWFNLSNGGESDGEWRIDLRRQYFVDSAVYVVRKSGTITTLFEQTSQDAFTDREIPSRYLATDLTLAKGETVDVLFSFRSTSPAYVPIAVGTKQAVVSDQAKETKIDTLVNGGLLVMMIIAALLIPIAGWQVCVTFLGYILAATFYVYQADGYAFQYLWPNEPERNDLANLATALSMPATGLFFSRALFNTKSCLGLWDKVIAVTAILAAILAITSPLYITNPILLWIAYCVVILGTAVQLVTAVFVVRIGLVGARPFLFGVSCVVFAISYATIAHIQPGYWSLDRTLDVGHAALLAECFAFVAAIVERMIAIKDQRDIALTAELTEVRRRLETEKELRVAQADFQQANSLSQARLSQLASVTHDIQTPVRSLRQIADKFEASDEAGTQSMHAALDYIEDLARLELQSATDAQKTSRSDGIETFSNRILLANISQLYSELAAQQGIQLRHVSNEIEVQANPVRLMRIVSNLVVNTIEHAEARKVLLACRICAGTPVVEVWDNGIGMSADEIEDLLQHGHKGEASKGTGLGLAIVEEECATEGFKFEICSRLGRGTCMRIVLK